MWFIVGIVVVVVFIFYKLGTNTTGRHYQISQEVLAMLENGITTKLLDYLSWDAFCYYAQKRGLVSTNQHPRHKFDHEMFIGKITYQGESYNTIFTKFADITQVTIEKDI